LETTEMLPLPGYHNGRVYNRGAYQEAKERAHRELRKAIRRGEIPDLKGADIPCDDWGHEDCRGVATDWDFRDYSKPVLFVIPVCHPCNVRRGPADVTPFPYPPPEARRREACRRAVAS
jgi:hypothetical protein